MAEATPPEVQKWLNAIAAYDREFKKWEGRSEKIIKRYKDVESDSRKQSRFNILWSNVQTLTPACYSRVPQPDVSRRFKDTDPVGRVAALILERALEFEITHYSDYRDALKNCVMDRFLPGRGIAWVRYDPTIEPIGEAGEQITEDVESESKDAQAAEQITDEQSPVDYVHWRDFGHVVARTWEEVPALWRKVYMGRPALVERFGEELGKQIPLDTQPKELKKSEAGADANYEALIYEIWDKEGNKALWLSKSLGKILDEKDDPLKLDGFWPCPKPLFATLTTDNLVPVPDFTLYQDQAMALDALSDRIDGLISALKVRGVYDAAAPELGRLFTEGDNNALLPVKNWAAFAEKQGLKGAIDLVDIVPIAQALEYSYKAFEQVKAQIYELTGISDIIRGETEASETATAQQIKGQYATLRLRDMQESVARFATEILQIKAQIICNNYQPETIARLGCVEQLNEADKQFIGPAIQLLKNGTLRDFRVEVATDSLVQIDEDGEKDRRVEFLTATGAFLEKAVSAVQQAPEITPLVLEMLKFGVTGFKVGKSLEGVFDETAEHIKQAAANPQTKPTDAQVKAQADLQAQQMQQQHEAQLEQFKAQVADQAHQRELAADMQAKQQEAQFSMQLEQHKQEMQAAQVQHQNQLEAEREMQRQQLEAAAEERKAQMEAAMEAQRLDFERYKAELDYRKAIEVAEIAAKTTLQAAQMSAASQAEKGESDAPV